MHYFLITLVIAYVFGCFFLLVVFSSVHFSCSVMSDTLRPHGLQQAWPPCPSPTPEAYSNSCPLSWWCHPTTSSSVIPFSSSLQSFPASGFFPMSQFFTSGSQSIGASASASVLPMNTQDWFPLGWIGMVWLYTYLWTNLHVTLIVSSVPPAFPELKGWVSLPWAT